MAPSCKLKLGRFSALLQIQDGADCGKIEVKKNRSKSKRSRNKYGPRKILGLETLDGKKHGSKYLT